VQDAFKQFAAQIMSPLRIAARKEDRCAEQSACRAGCLTAITEEINQMSGHNLPV
jgi:hypothetical protein